LGIRLTGCATNWKVKAEVKAEMKKVRPLLNLDLDPACPAWLSYAVFRYG